MSKSAVKFTFKVFSLLLILNAIRLLAKNISITRKDIQSEVTINAPASRVWQVLLDFEEYPHWNPFLKSMAGTASPGKKLTSKMHAGNVTMTLSPTVLVAEPERELRWLGRLFIPGLFDGEHSFIIEQLSKNRVRFIQHEEFHGLLVPFSTILLKDAESGFDEMNRALKKRAEREY